MLVKHINKNKFDIFYDKGWENWARFELQGKSLIQVGGESVPRPIEIFLNKRYSK